MMANLTAVLAAEGFAIDQVSNRVTAFNMIESVLLASLPSQLTRLVVITLYDLGHEPLTLVERVSVLSPSGNTLAQTATPLTLQARPEGGLPNAHRALHSFWRLPMELPGDYRLTVEHRALDGEDWTLAGSRIITAVVQPHGFLNAQAPGLTIPPAPSSRD